MKISTSFNLNDSRKNYQSFKGVPTNPKFIPEPLGYVGELAGKYVSTPEQKLFLATTALMLQPLIDLKFAQDDKKIDSAIKSAAKAIAGGLTGVAIRAAFIYFTKTKIGFRNTNKFNTFFLPQKARELYVQKPEEAKLQLAQYSQTLGTLLAILFMTLFSNRNIDVPLTSDLQDLISGVVKDNKSWLKSFSDVRDQRIQKIKNWCKKKKNKILHVHEKTTKVMDVLTDDVQMPTETKK